MLVHVRGTPEREYTYVAREYVITPFEPLGDGGNGVGVPVANLEVFFDVIPGGKLELATSMRNALVGLV